MVGWGGGVRDPGKRKGWGENVHPSLVVVLERASSD